MAGNKLNFTKGNIESLTLPEEKYTMLHDEKTPGLVLRVYPSGVKSFFLYRWTDGKPEYVSIGRYPALTPEQARRKAAELNSEIGAGKNPAEVRRNIRAEMTLEDLFDRYLENHAKKHKRTWEYDQKMYRLYFSHWGKRRISTITRREVQALHSRMGIENGECQANRAFAMIRTVFEKGREWGYAGENPCFKLKKFREESRVRALEAEELSSFFQSVMAEKNEMERDFLLLLLYTGARKSNVLGMAWKNVNLDLRIWVIPAAESKNGVSYTVPLISPALEIITRRKREAGYSLWVFPAESQSGHFQEPRKAWGRLLKLSGLEDLRPHDLRRSLGTWMLGTGSNEMTVAYALGHKLASQTVTAVYARASVEPIRVAMETAVRAMLRKGGVIPEEESIIPFKASV